MKLLGKGIRELLGFDDTALQLSLIPMISLFMPMAFFQSLPWVDFDGYWRDVVGSVIFTTIYWQVDRIVIAFFRARFPALPDNNKRILWQSAWILFFTLTLCHGIVWITEILGVSHDGKGPSKFVMNLASITITITITSVYEAVYSLKQWKQSSIETEQFKKASMQAQLETLKNQVNPHFLFNSLNTLTSIIHDEPDKAVEFVQKLSKVYRYILEIKDKELITLREEMECIESYKFLLQMRFGENVRFDINIPEERLSDHIIPLSAQILLENAIKHNVVSTGKPLQIRMHIGTSGGLIVSNNLQKKSVVNGSTQTGLANIKSRYQLLTGQSVEVITTLEKFSVSLPLINMELT
ncbi:MAG: histidine kinase [Flavobacteriales bacterium]